MAIARSRDDHHELAVLLEGRIERLPDDVIGALKILSLCEPIDLDVLGELAGNEAVEQAETRGLIQVSQDGDRFNARFTHPLFGEVIRRRLGIATSRRLRGQLVTVMRARGAATNRTGFASPILLSTAINP